MKIKIYANPKKEWAKALSAELSSLLSQTHAIVRKGADATVCIGGDGTILYANYKKRIEGIVLGIGSENSYICQLRKDSWKEGIEKILQNKESINVMTLECIVGGKTFNALNDIVVHATHYRVAGMDVSYETSGKKQETQFEGDGMIISSALGSAAYAFSAGGERFAPTERKLSLVPICPYKRAFSPQVLPEDGIAVITAGSDCALIIDGIYVRRLKKGEPVRVKKGRDILLFKK